MKIENCKLKILRIPSLCGVISNFQFCNFQSIFNESMFKKRSVYNAMVRLRLKIATLIHSMKIVNCKLKIIIVMVFALCALSLFLPKQVEAGLIVNRTLYLGLTNGLVGHWTFDGGDILCNQKSRRLGRMFGVDRGGVEPQERGDKSTPGTGRTRPSNPQRKYVMIA